MDAQRGPRSARYRPGGWFRRRCDESLVGRARFELAVSWSQTEATGTEFDSNPSGLCVGANRPAPLAPRDIDVARGLQATWIQSIPFQPHTLRSTVSPMTCRRFESYTRLLIAARCIEL